MARNQKNFSYFVYVDDDGNQWNIRGEDGGAASGVDGHTTDYTKPFWGAVTKRHHPRYAVYEDAGTYRRIKAIIYTPTAMAAIATGATLSVPVEGSATGVTYTLAEKIPEKNSKPRASHHLLDVPA